MAHQSVPPDIVHYMIYDHPRDYPDYFVVREWWIMRDRVEPVPGPATQHVSLQEAREQVPQGLHRIPRMPEDDPTIVEMWI